MIQRSKDMYLENEDLEHLFTMNKFPVYCGVTDTSKEKDQYENMEWMISRGSGMIQLGKLLPLERLYSVSHNSSYGGVWKHHHEEFADFLYQYAGMDGILEIGGGNGILCQVYNRRHIQGGGIRWTIIEPSKVKVVEGCTAQYEKKMWNGELDLAGIQYDTLVHSHLMEHQYELNAFMLSCAKALKTGQRMLFTLPNLKNWLKNKYSNALSFEHTYLISDDYIEGALNKYGFKILEKRDFGNGHSLFYATEKTNNAMCGELDFEKLFINNKRDFLEFIDFFKNKVLQYNEYIKECNKVYLFGAHVFSQMLVQFGLNIDKVQYILDNDPLKQGKRLYGTSLFVRSPKILFREREPVVILNMGAYSDEIKENIIKCINSKTIFWE